MTPIIRSNESVLHLLRLLRPHLSRRRKWQIVMLASLTVVSAFAEFLSLGAVFPFLAALVAPQRTFNYPVISEIVERLRLQSDDQLILILALLFIALMLMAAAIRVALSYGNTRLSVAIGSDIATKAYRTTLYQPYEQHVTLNSATLISNIQKAKSVNQNLVQPILMIVGSFFAICAIIGGLLIVDPQMTAIILVVVAMSYAIVAVTTQRWLHRNSRVIADYDVKRIKSMQEGLGGFRDIVLSGTQEVYCHLFQRSDRKVRWAQGVNVILASTPRIAIEALGAGVFAIVAYILSRGSQDVSTTIPVLGVLAIGAQRLLPGFQQLYASTVALNGGRADVADSLSLLGQGWDEHIARDQNIHGLTQLKLEKSVELRGVSFCYPEQNIEVLKNINLTIRQGETVAIVGQSGEGKSTLVDILMGLLTPSEGQVIVDGQVITEQNRLEWQNSFSHVPQNVFLTDTSLAENIAFGINYEDIDWQLLQDVASQAQLSSLIDEAPAGLKSIVGERGIRLSGGQRQRIGIARALYRRRDVLVLDEATSALDVKMEALVHAGLKSENRTMTVLMVAHRAESLRICDRRVVLEDGYLEERNVVV